MSTSVICEHCLCSFNSALLVAKHQRIAKYCQKYKDVLFLCTKCNYSTKGIKNIDTHVLECQEGCTDENPLENFQKSLTKLEEEKQLFRLRITTLETENHKLKDMELALKIEQLKNHIYKQIIEQKLGITIDDVFKVEGDTIHTYNLKDCKLSVFVHEHLRDQKGKVVPYEIESKGDVETKPVTKQKINVKNLKANNGPEHFANNTTNIVDSNVQVAQKSTNKNLDPVLDTIIKNHTTPIDEVQIEKDVPQEEHVDKKLKNIYKPIKNKMELIEEKTEQERKEAEYNVEEKIEDIIIVNFEECDVEKISAIIQDCFNYIRTNRCYNSVLQTLRKQRFKLLCRMTLCDYIKLLNNHCQILLKIFQEKNQDEKKIPSIIAKSMSPLDMRLITYRGYTKTSIEIDDIQQLDIVHNISVSFPKDFVPFSSVDLFNKFYNYSSVLSPIEENIKRYMFNRYGYWNIVYLPYPRSTDDDPYSFYKLETINKLNKRCWKMDCRAEDLANEFIDNVRPYLVGIFRNIYYDVFHDNEYRSDYMNKAQITDYDCEQLIQNILYLKDPILFTFNLRTIIKKHATYHPTINDQFNLYADDSLQKRRIAEHKTNESDNLDLIKTLFDNMTSEDALTFYRLKSSNCL